MPRIPLEDNFNDVINKTQRGLKISDEDLAQRAEVSLGDLAAIKGGTDRRNGSIIQLDDQGIEKVRWNFFDAWPSKYDGPDFSGKGNDASVDTLTLSCERLVRA